MVNSSKHNSLVIIGYSGHAYVVCDAFLANGQTIAGYCDKFEKSENPYALRYLGSETDASFLSQPRPVFVAIGDNRIRAKVLEYLFKQGFTLVNAIHPKSHISSTAVLKNGILAAANATINPLAQIGQGAILNTGCIVEHECQIGDYAHIAPGAVLAGNVTVGKRTFIGSNSVLKQGISIGEDVTVGAGSVVIRDLPDGVTVVGNPGRVISGNQKFKPFSV